MQRDLEAAARREAGSCDGGEQAKEPKTVWASQDQGMTEKRTRWSFQIGRGQP